MATRKTENTTAKATTKNSVKVIRPRLPSRGKPSAAKKPKGEATFPPISLHEYRSYVAAKVAQAVGDIQSANMLLVRDDVTVVTGWSNGTRGALVIIQQFVRLDPTLRRQTSDGDEETISLELSIYTKAEGSIVTEMASFVTDAEVRAWLKTQ